MLPTAFALEHGLPEFFWRRIEDQFERGGMCEPGIAFHFAFQLSRTPAGVPGEEFDFLGRRK
jgi:hypothetical protein